jgi:hypothetical protein
LVVPVEQRSSELLIAKDLDPLAECQFGGDDNGVPLVTRGEQIEQQLAAGALKWHESLGGCEASLYPMLTSLPSFRPCASSRVRRKRYDCVLDATG